jgi:prophage maintenance system killer protein
VVFDDLNGFDLDPPSVDEAVDLVVAVAAGHLDLSKLSQVLAGWARPHVKPQTGRRSRSSWGG